MNTLFSKDNLDAINAQLIEVGLQIDSNNKVTILNKEQWRQIHNQFDTKKKQDVFKNIDLDNRIDLCRSYLKSHD